MIATIIIVTMALVWLGYGTNWLRVRLICGMLAPVIEYEYKTWEELEPHQVRRTDQMWLRYPDTQSPLTGWDWLLNTMHIVPEYKIELIGPTYKTTMGTQDTNILRDAFKVNRNPYLKVKVA